MIMLATPDTIPADLTRLNQWLVWKYEDRDGKQTKVPYQSGRPYAKASSTDPATWSTHAAAAKCHSLGKTGTAGIGFVFSDNDPYTGVDLDDCLDGGDLKPWAAEILADLPPTYTEVSPSGNGLKMFFEADWPAGRNRTDIGDGQIEVYSRDRFFTVTGNRWKDAPITIAKADLGPLHRRLFPPKAEATATATTGGGFDGDLSGHNNDHSAADLALCSILAFYAGPDPDRIERLFKASALYREKSDREDYMRRTVDKALEGKTEFYSRGVNTNDTTIKLTSDVSLVPVEVDKTPKRRTLRALVHINGDDTGMEVVSTDTPRGIADAWRTLLEIADLTNNTIDDVAKVELKKLLTRKRLDQVAAQLDKAKPAEVQHSGPTMAAVAERYARDRLGMAFVVDDAMWSESLGRLFRRSDLTSYVPSDLLKKIASCCDYPEPTDADPTKPVKHLQQVLKTTWSDLLAALPREVDADLGPDSKAAAAFRAKLLALWNAPETWIKIEDAGKQQVERMSFASRVRHLANSERRQARPWTRVLRGVNAFYRVDDGRVWLGLRYDLLGGVIRSCTIPGVKDQSELHRLLGRYGLLDDTGVTDRYRDNDTGRRDRLAVLNQELADLLIECVDPGDTGGTGPESDDDDGPVVAEGLTIHPVTGEVIEA